MKDEKRRNFAFPVDISHMTGYVKHRPAGRRGQLDSLDVRDRLLCVLSDFPNPSRGAVLSCKAAHDAKEEHLRRGRED